MAEVSEWETYGRLAVVIHRWQSVDWKVVGVVFFGVVAMVAWPPHPQLLDVVWCSAAALVVVM